MITLALTMLFSPLRGGEETVVLPSDTLEVQRPAWAVEGVPDTVWMLVEAATEAGASGRTKALLTEAEVLARMLTAEASDDLNRRFALAAVLGMRTNVEGGRTKVATASKLHTELEGILALDPDHAMARHMLGRLHAAVQRMGRFARWIATNLLGGGALAVATWEEAERNLAFAEARVPEVIDHHLQLANLYRDTERPEEAKLEVTHALELPATAPSELAAREEALRLLETLSDCAALSASGSTEAAPTYPSRRRASRRVRMRSNAFANSCRSF